jgi:hypothetical protein
MKYNGHRDSACNMALRHHSLSSDAEIKQNVNGYQSESTI